MVGRRVWLPPAAECDDGDAQLHQLTGRGSPTTGFAPNRIPYRRVHILLKREGWQLGRSQAYRLYSEEQLQLRSKLPKRRKMVVQRRQRIEPRKAGDAWTMDFVADEFGRGGKFKVLTVVDVFTRQATEAGLKLKGENGSG